MAVHVHIHDERRARDEWTPEQRAEYAKKAKYHEGQASTAKRKLAKVPPYDHGLRKLHEEAIRHHSASAEAYRKRI